MSDRISSLISRVMNKGATLFHKATGHALKESIKSETIEEHTQLIQPYRFIVRWLSILCAVYVIAGGLVGTIFPYLHRALFLGFILPVVFIRYPANRSKKVKTKPTPWDLFLCVLAIGAVGVIALDVNRILWRMPFIDQVFPRDIAVGMILIFCVVEACRRIIGWALVVLTCLFLAYGLWGNYLPGLLAHGGVSFRRLIEYLILMSDGLFSSTAGIGATYVFTFVAFGTLLSKTRLGDAIFNIAKALTRNALGAPAKVAVISSAFMAMISGSAVANVVTTGSITIPLMKKVGFRNYEAAAIEVASSVGGQITPPIMGSGIFIMAELTGTPLSTLLWLSAIPAVLYYIMVYVFVNNHIQIRHEVGEIVQVEEELPSISKELKESALFALPIIILCVMMFMNYSAYFSSSVSILLLLGTTFIQKKFRPDLKTVLNWFEAMTQSAITVASIIACSALVVGVVFLTGFVVTASSAIIRLAGGSLVLVTLLAMLMCLVLGTSLPITVSYLIISILGVPAFTKLGVPLLSAHIAIFWFSQVATITPPVCTTSFLAADIAGAPRFLTGFTGLKFASGMLIIPFCIVFNNLIVGTFAERAIIGVIMAVGLIILAYALDGYLKTTLNIFPRVVLLVSAFILLFASTQEILEGKGFLLIMTGVAMFVAILVVQKNRKRKMYVAAEGG